MDNGSNVKHSKFSKTDNPMNYTLLLKSNAIMKHLYNSSEFIKISMDDLIAAKRKHYSYYIDKFKNHEEIEGAVRVEITDKKWVVYEGNHRAIAQHDLGFKQMVCEVRFNYHKIFNLKYPFIKTW